jgi:hypothetical protein
MKTIKWDKVDFKGATKTVPAKGVKVQAPHQANEGMTAIAQYNGIKVRLRIKEVLKPEEYRATVICFDPIEVEKPADLNEGTEVFIKQEAICWLHED